MRFLKIIIAGLSYLSIVLAHATNLTAVDLTSQSGQKSQLVMNFNGPVTYKYFTLEYPPRLVIDLANTHLHTKLNINNLAGSAIKDIRSGHFLGNTLRIVLDLNYTAHAQVNVVDPRRHFGSSLQVTLTSTSHARVAPPVHTKSKGTIHFYHPPVKAYKKISPHPYKLRKIIVVLDPGHGGKDPGATGHSGIREKNITLAIARQLQKLINQQPGMSAVLTRKGDYYIGLRQRLNIARKDGADVFISIHADAFNNPNSHGSSVYALSPRGATSEAARWLAEKENYSELGGVNLAYLKDKDALVRSVLIDLSQTATIGASLTLGRMLLHSLDVITDLHHHGVEQARFVVLKSPDIPSVLIETGFISNGVEERKLASSSYRQKLALSVLKGVKSYFRMQPPPGTYWEAEKNSGIFRG